MFLRPLWLSYSLYVPRNRQDIKVCRCSRKAYGIFFLTRSDICQQILVQIANTTLPVLPELFHANRQTHRWTDMTKLNCLFKTCFASALGKNVCETGLFFPSSGEMVGAKYVASDRNSYSRSLTTYTQINFLCTWSNSRGPRTNTHQMLKDVNGNETLISDTSLQMV